MGDWLEFPSDSRGRAAESHEEARGSSPAEELMRSGESLYYEGEFCEAADAFRRARRYDPALFDAWAAEVDARILWGDLTGAEQTADEALRSFGQAPIFYAAKALVLAHQGHIEAACEHSDIAVRETTANMFTWLSRAEVVLATGLWGTRESVESCFARATQADPSGWHANLRAALCLLRWDRAQHAVERLARVAQAVPANPFVWKTMGDCHRALGQAAAARDCYRKALECRQGYAPALQALDEMTLWGRLRKWVRS